MRRGVLVLLTAAVFGIAPSTSAAPVIQGDVLKIGCPHMFSGDDFVLLARRAFADRKWKDRSPIGPGLRREVGLGKACAISNKARRRMERIWHGFRHHFYIYRKYRKVSPIRGYTGQGRWLEWLPIPRYIVDCETRGYYGEGKWHARNPSGANGPAQLLGHGQPYPAISDEQRLAYWEITRRLYLQLGVGPWSCG